MCDQQSLRSACTYALSDLSLCLSHKYSMKVKVLTDHYLGFLRLKVGCTGWSDSTLVKIPHCWKSHVAAHMGLLARKPDIVEWEQQLQTSLCIPRATNQHIHISHVQIQKVLSRVGPNLIVFFGDGCWHPDSILTLTVFQSRRFFTLARPYIKYMLHSLQIFRHISCMVSILTI